jgi:hypothetical protein
MGMKQTTILAAGILALAVSGANAQDIKQAAADETAPSVEVIGSRQADGILGKEVRSKTGENMGRLIDVVVDRVGRPRAAVIDFGGFLGVGSRKIAIDWNALSFETDGNNRDVVTVELTRDQVKAAPEYKERRAVIVLGSAASPLTRD